MFGLQVCAASPQAGSACWRIGVRNSDVSPVSEKGGLLKSPDAPTRWGQLIFSPAVPYGTQRTYFSGGGGLTSTATDYLRFTQMFLNGGQLDGVRLLSRKSVELMAMNHLGDISVWSYVPPSAASNLGDKFGLGFGVRSE